MTLPPFLMAILPCSKFQSLWPPRRNASEHTISYNDIPTISQNNLKMRSSYNVNATSFVFSYVSYPSFLYEAAYIPSSAHFLEAMILAGHHRMINMRISGISGCGVVRVVAIVPHLVSTRALQLALESTFHCPLISVWLPPFSLWPYWPSLKSCIVFINCNA